MSEAAVAKFREEIAAKTVRQVVKGSAGLGQRGDIAAY